MQQNLADFSGLLYARLLIYDSTRNKIWSGYLRQANVIYVMSRVKPYVQFFRAVISGMLYDLDDKHLFRITMAYIRYLDSIHDTDGLVLFNHRLTLKEVTRLLATGACRLPMKIYKPMQYYNVSYEYDHKLCSRKSVYRNRNIDPNHRLLHLADTQNPYIDPEIAVDQHKVQEIIERYLNNGPIWYILSTKMHKYIAKNWDIYHSKHHIKNPYFSWDIIVKLYEINHKELLENKYLLMRSVYNGFHGVKGFNWQAPASALHDIKPNPNSGLYKYKMIKKNIASLPDDLYSLFLSTDGSGGEQKEEKPCMSCFPIINDYIRTAPDLWDILAYLELKPGTKSVYLYEDIELDLKVELVDFI